MTINSSATASLAPETETNITERDYVLSILLKRIQQVKNNFKAFLIIYVKKTTQIILALLSLVWLKG